MGNTLKELEWGERYKQCNSVLINKIPQNIKKLKFQIILKRKKKKFLEVATVLRQVVDVLEIVELLHSWAGNVLFFCNGVTEVSTLIILKTILVCLYVHVYIRMLVYVHWVCVCPCMCICVYVCFMHLCVLCVCVHTFMYVCLCTCMCVCLHACSCMCLC